MGIVNREYLICDICGREELFKPGYNTKSSTWYGWITTKAKEYRPRFPWADASWEDIVICPSCIDVIRKMSKATNDGEVNK